MTTFIFIRLCGSALVWQVWFGEHMLQPKFVFHRGYGIPSGRTVEDYAEFIKNLPAVDSPQVFGLHPNADITFVSRCFRN